MKQWFGSKITPTDNSYKKKEPPKMTKFVTISRGADLMICTEKNYTDSMRYSLATEHMVPMKADNNQKVFEQHFEVDHCEDRWLHIKSQLQLN